MRVRFPSPALFALDLRPRDGSELRVLIHERESNNTSWAISMLPHDELCFAPGFGVVVVDLVSVDEHDDVRVLLDASRFSQVTKQRALVGAHLDTTVQL